MGRTRAVVNVVEDRLIEAIDARSGASAREQEERNLVREFQLAEVRAKRSEPSDRPRRRRIVA